ncbi:hypothetical protein [Kitasatospora cinereorecta]|uniref:WD40 repeat domain-containing protein n=1 Tax=Kitasatospora cinereorecta TaxID=285560 RepID=A0ABW0VC61_9ACTN
MRTRTGRLPRPGTGAAGRWGGALGAAVLLLAAAAAPVAAEGSRTEFTIADPRITESSGLAASLRHPGVYWTHNDSDDGPYVYAVDSTGRTVATVTLRGVKPRDAEAISLGPDGSLYLADIGDNLDGSWSEVWLYRFAEPADLHDQTVDATRYRVRYEDGPRNAEALMIHPVTGRAYIASKNERTGGLYQGPETLTASGVNTFHRIADVPWVTDGAFSPDGTRLVLRGYFLAESYRWKDGAPQRIGALDVPFQRQGESVTFAPDGRSLLYGSEGRNSTVVRVPLSGDRLPDSVAAQATPTPSAPAGGPASGTPAAAPATPAGKAGSSRGTGILVAVGVVALLALVFRRRRSS